MATRLYSPRASQDLAASMQVTHLGPPDLLTLHLLYPFFPSVSFLVSHLFFTLFHLSLPAVIYILYSFLFVSFALVLSERIRKAYRTVVNVAINGPDSNQNLRN